MDDLVWWSQTPYPSWEIHKVLKGLLQAEMLPARTEGTEKGQNKQRPLSSPNSAVFGNTFFCEKETVWYNFSFANICYLQEGIRTSLMVELQAQWTKPRTQRVELWSLREELRNMQCSSQALNHDESFPVGFWTFKSMR